MVAIGNNMKETIKKCIDRAHMIKADGLEYNENCFKKIIQSIEAGKRYGIRW